MQILKLFVECADVRILLQNKSFECRENMNLRILPMDKCYCKLKYTLKYFGLNLLSVSHRKWQFLCSIRRSLIAIRSLRRIRLLIRWRKVCNSWPGYDTRASSRFSIRWRSPGDHNISISISKSAYVDGILGSLDKYA